MTVTANCVLDKKYCKAYTDAIFPARVWISALNTAISVAVLIGCIALGFSDYDKAPSLILPLIFLLINNIIIGVIFATVHLFQYKELKDRKDAQCQYIFGQYSFKIITTYKNGKITESPPVNYSNIKKVKVTKDKIIIFERSFVAHLIEKKKLNGDGNELATTIKSQIQKDKKRKSSSK